MFDGGPGDDELVVSDNVTLESGSRVTGVEKVTLNGGGSLTVDDTVFPGWNFALGCHLAINQTNAALDLSSIKKESNHAAIEITGHEEKCTIKLELTKQIEDTIAIRTADAEDNLDDSDAAITTITGFNTNAGDGPVDKLVFTGIEEVANGVITLTDGTFEELINKVKQNLGVLDDNAACFGAHAASNTSFAIMQTDDGILAVKLTGVTLDDPDVDIFV